MRLLPLKECGFRYYESIQKGSQARAQCYPFSSLERGSRTDRRTCADTEVAHLGWLELGFLVALASSVLVSMFQVLVAAGNLAE